MSAKTGAGTHETEWQLEADNLGAVEHWLAAHTSGLGYAVADAGVEEQQDTYYDTEDWRLHRAGYALRLRTKGEHTEATLKALTAAADGRREREELTENLDSATLEPLSSAPGLLGKRTRTITGAHKIRPVFEVITRRHTFVLSRDSDTDVADVALDEVTIPTGEDTEPRRFVRVEVEAHGSADESLEAFVATLRAENRLRPAGGSKYEEGLATRDLDPSRPGLGPTEIDGALSTGEVAFAVLRRQFATFLENELGVRYGEDPEAVHDMRVAARRMRAALSLFRDALPADAERLRAELRWIAQALGVLRDLDVQLGQMEQWRQDAGEQDRAALDTVAGVLRQRRSSVRFSAIRALDSQRYDRLVADLTSALQAGPAGEAPQAAAPVLAVAPDLVGKRYRTVLRTGDAITPASAPEEYHRLRIECKKLRYALEFFTPLYRKAVRGPIGNLVAVQDVLGRHQDAEVATANLRDFASGAGRAPAVETAFVLGGIARRYEEEAARERARFPKVYKGLKGKEWKRLQQAMEKRRPAPIAEPAPADDADLLPAYVEPETAETVQ